MSIKCSLGKDKKTISIHDDNDNIDKFKTAFHIPSSVKSLGDIK